MQHSHRWSRLAITACLLAFGLIGANKLPAHTVTIHQSHSGTKATASSAAKPKPTFVGTDTGKTCHADVFNSQFKNTPHDKTLFSPPGCSAASTKLPCGLWQSEHFTMPSSTLWWNGILKSVSIVLWHP